jgi:hypothetical protein
MAQQSCHWRRRKQQFQARAKRVPPVMNAAQTAPAGPASLTIALCAAWCRRQGSGVRAGPARGKRHWQAARGGPPASPAGAAILVHQRRASSRNCATPDAGAGKRPTAFWQFNHQARESQRLQSARQGSAPQPGAPASLQHQRGLIPATTAPPELPAPIR